MPNQDYIIVDNWEQAYQDFGCEPPDKPLKIGPQSATHWGLNSEGKKNQSISGFFVNQTKEMMTLTNHVTKKTQNYLLKKVKFQKPNLTFKESKDISKEFHSMQDCETHSYLTAKKIKIPNGLTLKRDNRKVSLFPFIN